MGKKRLMEVRLLFVFAIQQGSTYSLIIGLFLNSESCLFSTGERKTAAKQRWMSFWCFSKSHVSTACMVSSWRVCPDFDGRLTQWPKYVLGPA